MVERGAALFALDHHNLQYKLKQIIEDATLLRGLQEGAESLGKPRAAFDILKDVCSRISPGT
jgi:UDP-N-acetylglucosamine:LPS N-acetylglucosamine transferase